MNAFEPLIICAGIAIVFLVIGRGVVMSPDMPVPLDEVVRGYPYRGVFG